MLSNVAREKIRDALSTYLHEHVDLDDLFDSALSSVVDDYSYQIEEIITNSYEEEIKGYIDLQLDEMIADLI